MKIHSFIQTVAPGYVLYYISLNRGWVRWGAMKCGWAGRHFPDLNLWTVSGFLFPPPQSVMVVVVLEGWGGGFRGGANGFLSEGDKSGCGDWRTNGASPWFTRTPAPPSPLQERKVLVLIVSAWLQRRAGRWKDSDTETKIKTIKEILKMWRCRPVSVFTLWKLKTTRHLRFLIFGDVNFRWVGKESSCVGTEAVRDGK